MRLRTSRFPLVALVAAIAAFTACGTPAARTGDPRVQGTSPRDTAFVRPLYGPTWTLVHLRGAAAPMGAGGRPATLIFYSGTQRTAAGFAGCNRWSSTYTIAPPDSIAFTAPIATKMACDQGMQLETDFLALITRASRIARRDSTLVLKTPMGDSAVFVARDE